MAGARWGFSQQSAGSNLRKKIITVQADTLMLDTLSIIPGSFSIAGIAPETWQLDHFTSKLIWITRPAETEVVVTYRVFPGRFQPVLQRLRFDSISNNFIAGATVGRNELVQQSIFDFGNINYNGSFGRGLSFGNQQDVVLNSTLNLQLSGYLADSVQIVAAITDSNIPVQPDGNTQNLNEFDKVFIQFKKNNWHFDIGDIDIRQQQSYFLNYYSRLQGAAFGQQSRISNTVSNTILLSGAMAKGKFTRNVFQGIEGNQGPYRLQAPNNELFFIVLAGTERVFIDGEIMQRGEDQDYVINYNTAEISFTPRQMITKDKRIQVEFGYADRNYLNSQLYLADEASIGKKLKLRLAAYSNADAKNSPINQTLNAEQKHFLSSVGDSIQQAFYPSQMLDTFSVNKILYKKIDTVYNVSLHDSVFVYSANNQDTLYNLAFTEVGYGKGNYVLDQNNAANGKVFKWISPDADNNPQGSFEPVILLIAPRKQQLVTVGADYSISENTVVSTELALSNYNINSFSSKDKADDMGFAGRVTVHDNRPLKKGSGAKLLTQAGYEWVENRFRPVERLRSVEFYRDWGLPITVTAATENLFRTSIQLNDKNNNSVRYIFETYKRADGYNGIKNGMVQRADYGTWHFNNQVYITSFGLSDQRGYYLKPVLDVSKDFPKLGNHRIGVGYTLDHNYIKYRQYDSLNTGSFSFDIWQAYIRSPQGKPNKWGVTYYTRSDQYPFGGQLHRTDRSNNINLSTELMKNPKHQLRANVTYRNLHVLNDKITSLQAEETILGRAEYFVNEWKGLLNGNLLYEVGTGQEQKRDYTYIEVPPGQGEYTWIDYNNNGIPELNEFEVSQFRDQAKYIRIFTPTNEFVKANYLQFNYSIVINPRAVIDMSKASGFQKFLTRLYFQSSLQVYKKSLSGKLEFNPFAVPMQDTSLILLNQVLSNSFSFNRFSSVWGMDINNIRTDNKSFLTYGYESRHLDDWNIKGRWNISRNFLLELLAKQGNNKLTTPNFDNRNYHIRSVGTEPRLSFIQRTNFRIMTGYRHDNKYNTEGSQKATIHSVNAEVKYNILSNTSIASRFTFSQIRYTDKDNGNIANTPVSYIMLDALLPGKNYLWTMDLTKRLSSFLELNIQYEGRKSGESNMVHIGRASVRALF
ncbi:MAG: hypothetical protein KIT80_00345 [Chitinophagaceae bacterium]|nr:hypothetical protein [Chitinophagaceae bacterium]MCW5925340.1 hypothetical protein [Chitinophagaceae bacterium]